MIGKRNRWIVLWVFPLLVSQVLVSRAATFTVSSPAASGPGSLAAAVAGANGTTSPSTIAFNLSGAGVHTLPGAVVLSAAVTVDGTTQPGYAGLPLVDIPGGVTLTGAGCALIGLSLGGTNSPLGVEIDGPSGSNAVVGCFIGTGPYGTNGALLKGPGLYIKSSPGNHIGGTNASQRNLLWANSNNPALYIYGAGSIGNVVQGNWIGLDVTGLRLLPGGVNDGIYLDNGVSNLIGGAVTGAGNVISGAVGDGFNYGHGISVQNEAYNYASCVGNIIQGNYIGLDAPGLHGLGNAGYGIALKGGVAGSFIGGAQAGAGNVIASNGWGGITISAYSSTNRDANVVQGNLIGTDASGLRSLGNRGGVSVQSTGYNLIGGDSPGAGNVISGNSGTGVNVGNADGTVIQGNFIGVDRTGTNALANTGDGIFAGAIGLRIGGGAAGAGNVVSANQIYGIYEYGCSNSIIQGNFIGTDASGQAALGNTYDGISLDAALAVVIGGANAGEGNVIAGNGTEGICIGRYSPSTNISVVGNRCGVAAPARSWAGSVVLRAPGASPAPKGGEPYLMICVPFDNTYGSYPLLVNQIDAVCPPTPFNWIAQNVFGCCNNSPVDIPNGGSCSWEGNTLICPVGMAPCTTSGSPAAPTLTPSTGGSLDLGVTGPANAAMNTTIYGVSPLGSYLAYTPLTQFSVSTGAGGAGAQSVDPTSAPLAGFQSFACGVADPCGGLSELCAPVSVTPVATTAPPGTTAANFMWSGSSGCPVSTFTGELYESPAPDLVLGGPLSLQFRRYYAAWLKRDGFIAGTLGDNWLHNFEMRLTPPSNHVVVVVTQLGRVIQFTNSPAGGFALIGRQDVPYQLVGTATNYVLGDPFSQRLYTFDTTGRLVQVADGRGNAHSLLYSGGLLSKVADGSGHSLLFQYSASGLLTNVSDGWRAVAFTQSGGLLTQAVDPLGAVTTYAYDAGNAASGLMTSQTQPEGNVPFAQAFDAEGRVATQIEAGAAPGTNTFAYAATNTTMSDPYSAAWQDRYSAPGELTQSVDPSGHTLTMTYNAKGQRISVTDRLGYTTSLGYHDGSGKMAAFTNADGSVVTLSYSSRVAGGMTFYDLTGIAYPDGASESTAYDAQGNIVSQTDRAGLVSRLGCNARGQVLAVTNPAGGVITATYHPDGTLATRADSDLGTTVYLYDQFRRLTNVVNPDATVTKMTYDAASRLTSATDELGHTFTFAYDRNGNLKQMTEAYGNSASCGYDGRNRLVAFTNRVGAVTTFSYDARGLLVTNTAPTGEVTTFAYDSRRRPSAATDPAGHSWQTGYDNEDLLASATNPSGEMTATARNRLGVVTTTTDPLTNRVAFTRDPMQRVTLALDPLSRSNSYAYDARGILSEAGRQGLGAAQYHHSPLGLIDRITDLNGNLWSLGYTPMGRLQSATDPLGRTRSFSYDARGRLQRLVFADGVTCVNTYDATGNPVNVRYSAGPVLNYTYDALNRIATTGDLALAFDAEGRLTNTLSSGVNFGAAYDASGRLIRVSYFNGAFSVAYGYDPRGLLTNVTDTLTGARVALDYDASSRLVSMTRGNGVNGAYAYDTAGRLTRMREGGFINLQFGLDAAGEIIRETVAAPLDVSGRIGPSLLHLAYDAADQIAAAGYAYDARGRLTASPGHTFAWDGASRLVAIDGVELAYNGLNQLLTRTQGGVTQRYFYNRAVALAPIMAERDETTGQVLRYYVWTPDGRLLYLIDAARQNAVSYYHFDQAGSTLALSSADGSVSDAYAYTPYGAPVGHAGSSTQPFTYIGEYGVRGETSAGLYDMRARYYDPLSARFLSPDSLWPRLSQPDSLDPYEYALRNPLSYLDPAGGCEISGSGVVGTFGAVLNGAGAQCICAYTATQSATDLANSEALSLAEKGANELFGWVQGYMNGGVAEFLDAKSALYTPTYSQEQAVETVNMLFGGTPGNPFGPGAKVEQICGPAAEVQAKSWWYSNLQEEIATAETKGAQLSQRASTLRAVGTGLAVVGATVQTGAAVYRDYQNGVGVVITATDGAATLVANAALVAAPPLAGVDLVTGGAISGGIHNACMTPNTVARVALGRVSTVEADGIKAAYTDFAVGRWAWYAGEYWYEVFQGK